jgi:hypothetical protein
MPTPKAIHNKVGRQPARNEPDDAEIVADLLMRVSAADGGPELVIFPAPFPGMSSPSLVAAIERFQRRQMGFSDGRVDPGGATLARLNRLTNNGAAGKRTITPFTSLLRGAVGRAPAPNNIGDVIKLVALLRLVPPNEGGARPALLPPAMPGQLPSGLIPAIETFQRRQFGASDGRVDPGQKTEIRLREIVKTPV